MNPPERRFLLKQVTSKFDSKFDSPFEWPFLLGGRRSNLTRGALPDLYHLQPGLLEDSDPVILHKPVGG